MTKRHPFPFERAPRAVLFDNDGVVLNSEPIIFRATAQVFAAYDIRITSRDIQEGIGAGAKYVQDPMQKYGLRGVAVEDLMRAREAAFRELAVDHLKPFADFVPLANFLRRHGVRTALASSAATDVVLHNLAVAGVDRGLFDVIVDSSKIERKKPAPDIFLAGAASLAISPADCLVIEDAPPGITAAMNAGMPVVAVTTSFPRTRLRKATMIVRSLGNLHQAWADFLGVAMEA